MKHSFFSLLEGGIFIFNARVSKFKIIFWLKKSPNLHIFLTLIPHFTTWIYLNYGVGVTFPQHKRQNALFGEIKKRLSKPVWYLKHNCIVSCEIKYYFISRRQGLILCFTWWREVKLTLFHSKIKSLTFQNSVEK